MEVAQVPEEVTLVEPVDTFSEHEVVEMIATMAGGSVAEDVKILELEAPSVQEARAADVSTPIPTISDAVPTTENSDSKVQSPRVVAAEVVTPAGTVDVAPLVQEEGSKTSSFPASEIVPCQPLEIDFKEEITALPVASDVVTPKESPTESATPLPAEREEKPLKCESASTVYENVASDKPAPQTSHPRPEKKPKKQNESFASEETLSEVQAFLTLHIVENRCTSHAKEINEFVANKLNDMQRKRYVAPLVERVVQHFAEEAAAKGEEVSLDVQSNICLVEQMFTTLGRRSPLQDMYTAEEEEMLDLLFHSNSSDNLPIDI